MPWNRKNEVIESDNEVYQVWQLFNEKMYIEIDFYIEIVPLNLMYVDKKRLFDDYIQSIIAEAPQPSEPAPIKKSRRNIKSVSRKRRKGKTIVSIPAPTLEPEHDLDLVVPSPLEPEAIHEIETEPSHEPEAQSEIETEPPHELSHQTEIETQTKPQHQTEPLRIAAFNVLTTQELMKKIKPPKEASMQ